jgi:hypothetical protein
MRHLYCAGLALCLSSSAALAVAAVPGEPSTGLPLALLFFAALSVLGGLAVAGFRSTRPPTVLAAAMGLLVLVPALAYAQTATPSGTVAHLEWGDATNSLFKVAMEAILPFMATAITVATAYLPWWVKIVVTPKRIDWALQTGAAYALNAVAGATAGKALDVNVGYNVLKVALERILGSTPAWVIKEMGGAKGISERLFRVFHFDENVTDKNTLLRLIDDLPSIPFAAGK